jgi:acetylornithine deacetylase/succinyl-diaminopimelate desuccinylase-like protein
VVVKKPQTTHLTRFCHKKRRFLLSEFNRRKGSIRHSIATTCLRDDRDVFALHNLLGHPDFTMVKHYIPVPAFRNDKNTLLARTLLAGIRSQNAQPSFVLKSGTSDMNIVGPRWNCPMVAYGPGDSSLDHTPQEHVSLAEYNNSVQVLAHAFDTLAR